MLFCHAHRSAAEVRQGAVPVTTAAPGDRVEVKLNGGWLPALAVKEVAAGHKMQFSDVNR